MHRRLMVIPWSILLKSSRLSGALWCAQHRNAPSAHRLGRSICRVSRLLAFAFVALSRSCQRGTDSHHSVSAHVPAIGKRWFGPLLTDSSSSSKSLRTVAGSGLAPATKTDTDCLRSIAITFARIDSSGHWRSVRFQKDSVCSIAAIRPVASDQNVYFLVPILTINAIALRKVESHTERNTGKPS